MTGQHHHAETVGATALATFSGISAIVESTAPLAVRILTAGLVACATGGGYRLGAHIVSVLVAKFKR